MTQERRIASGTLVETKTHIIGQQARTYISELFLPHTEWGR